MAFKSIDNTEQDWEGFTYKNKHGDDEYVIFENVVGGKIFTIKPMKSDEARVWLEDVPSLVKALKAAYKHQTGKDIDD